MNGDAHIVRDALGQRGAVEADEVDVRAIGRQRMRVILHAGASSQVSQRNDDGSHSGIVLTPSGPAVIVRP